MKIWKRLRPEHVFLNLSLKDKDAVLHFAANTFACDGIVGDASRLYEDINKREETMSTGIGKGVGIPHAASWEADDAAIILIRLAAPIDFEALDSLPVDVILVLVIPENQITLHLQMLASISRLCQDLEFTSAVRQAKDPNNLLEKIKALEKEIAFH